MNFVETKMQVDDATKKLGYRLAWGAQWMGEPFCISFRDQDVKSLLFFGCVEFEDLFANFSKESAETNITVESFLGHEQLLHLRHCT